MNSIACLNETSSGRMKAAFPRPSNVIAQIAPRFLSVQAESKPMSIASVWDWVILTMCFNVFFLLFIEDARLTQRTGENQAILDIRSMGLISFPC